MRGLLVRLAVLGALALPVSGCGGNAGLSLPYAGPPNNAGGNSGTLQSGATSTGLIRFVQGSPNYASVDVCIDETPLGNTAPSVAYGHAGALFSVGAGIGHTVSVYPPITFPGESPGSECATAPGPFFGTAPIAETVVTPSATLSAGARVTVVLGGTTKGNLGLYVFTEPSFAAAAAGPEAIAHNAAPTFSASGADPLGTVGFGYEATAGGAPTTIPGEGSVALGKKSSGATATANASVVGAVPQQVALFYDGAGVSSGTVVPIATATPTITPAQPYVIDLYAIDAAGGSLGLVAVQETTVGYGF